MLIVGNLLITVAEIVNMLLNIYYWVVIVAALISWVNPDPYNPVVRFLRAVTEPLFRPIRRLIGYRLGPIDISPIIVILGILFVQKFLVRSIIEIGYKIKGGAFI
ncbi:MAG TPA: YggT family protein [Thermodesulfovibrionales bacterium]|nr:YggT family protein [Thermodesulfovibrionales bacterium]